MQSPLITSNHLREKFIQPENVAIESSQPHRNPIIENAATAQEQANEISSSPADSSSLSKEANNSNKSKKLLKKDIKRNKRLEKKRLKQQQKQQKQLAKINKKAKKNQNNERNNQKKGNSRNSATTGNDNETNSKTNLKRSQSPLVQLPTVPPAAKSKPLPSVKFAFDTIDNEPETSRTEAIIVHDACTVDANAIVIDDENQMQCDNKQKRSTATRHSNGEYDVLPLIKIEKSDDFVDGHFVHQNNDDDFAGAEEKLVDQNGNTINNEPVRGSSSETIPFIDDESLHYARRAHSVPIEQHGNLYTSRFITLQPQNIGTQSVIYARKMEKPLPLASKLPPKRDPFDNKSADILYQSLKESIDHHFERAARLNSRLCQVCHEFLLVPEAVKCLTCGLVCHHSCTLQQVSDNL